MSTNRALISAGAGQCRRPQDFYPTPRWVVEALLAREKFFGTVWEPACGQGHISKVLEEQFYLDKVISSDLYPTFPVMIPGVKLPKDLKNLPEEELKKYFTFEPIHKGGIPGLDFIKGPFGDNTLYPNSADCIITNPPFCLFTEFVEQAKRKALHKFSFLAKTNHLHGEDRYKRIWLKSQYTDYPLKSIYCFCRRIQFEGYSCTTTLEMVWLTWQRDYSKSVKVDWIP